MFQEAVVVLYLNGDDAAESLLPVSVEIQSERWVACDVFVLADTTLVEAVHFPEIDCVVEKLNTEIMVVQQIDSEVPTKEV